MYSGYPDRYREQQQGLGTHPRPWCAKVSSGLQRRPRPTPLRPPHPRHRRPSWCARPRVAAHSARSPRHRRPCCPSCASALFAPPPSQPCAPLAAARAAARRPSVRTVLVVCVRDRWDCHPRTLCERAPSVWDPEVPGDFPGAMHARERGPEVGRGRTGRRLDPD